MLHGREAIVGPEARRQQARARLVLQYQSGFRSAAVLWGKVRGGFEPTSGGWGGGHPHGPGPGGECGWSDEGQEEAGVPDVGVPASAGLDPVEERTSGL